MKKDIIFLLQKIKPKFIFSVFMTIALSVAPLNIPSAVATNWLAGGFEYLSCTDFKFVFARGSGAKVNSERDFIPFKKAVDEVFGGTKYSYSFYELGSRPDGWNGYSYPAPGIGISTWERFETSLGALISGGELHAYGDSVENGSIEASYYWQALKATCPDTKIVFAGYSQGAQVISRTLQQLEPSNLFAALTFGDPKLYLPEGKMELFTRSTPACRNEKISNYRAFVPDCYTYQGILGGYKPYQASDKYSGKLKAYCQWHDVICSSFIDLDNLIYGHASYDEQGTYLRAIQDVYNMLEPGTYSRPAQNLAILFDATDSMRGLLNQFKNEAIRAANKVINLGGKVALYTYGDLDEVEPVKLCDFETCTSENIERYIKGIEVSGGGDTSESLLSASYNVMRELKWEMGANKSIIVLTDAPAHNPDRDGITMDNVVELSKSIDPVNFYILTYEGIASKYKELAERTNGGVYTSNVASAFSDLEDDYLSRTPSAVYESTDMELPIISEISDIALKQASETSLKIDVETDATALIVSIGDYIAGFTEEKSFEVTDLDLEEEIDICVSPVSSNGFRGNSSCISWKPERPKTKSAVSKTIMQTQEGLIEVVIPKAPNTGKALKHE